MTTTTAGATDSMDASVTQAPVSKVTTVEQAQSVLKAKTGVLHGLVHGVETFSHDVILTIEGLLGDIKYLTSFIHSKL